MNLPAKILDVIRIYLLCVADAEEATQIISAMKEIGYVWSNTKLQFEKEK